ncbi:hypothetical protein BDY24DRAFT_109550 [Mrakia frigida]|uniref:ATP-binding mismatch repair protein n=1 Tax=Mrakia frigida TaxID=29902 RepID=UPI003FCC259B
MSSNHIKQIDNSSVHRITSGQVIVDLQTAVKELVENALDASATAIEVKFKNMGLDSIEVSDNGSGVPSQDYASLELTLFLSTALKHHTSKLTTFSDLTSVLSFGFRGEALSSLCGLSESVEITTATAEETPTGSIIQFDRSGRVTDDKGKTARPRGTTVVVTGLFVPVPVRRKELEKNAKREFAKALTLLHAYALNSGSKGQAVRLTVVGMSKEGKKTVHIKTDGNPGLKASISSLWSPKELVNLVSVDLEVEVEMDKSSAGRDPEQATSHTLRVVGMVSAPVPGKGRSSSDRQFLYVNGRPCSLPKVQKVINDVYRTFNTSQTPFVVLDLQLPPECCDINVSPDKRTIFLHDESNLLQGLRSALEKLFAPSKSEYAVSVASRLSDDAPHAPIFTSSSSSKLVQSTFPTSTLAARARPREVTRSPSPLPPPSRLLPRSKSRSSMAPSSSSSPAPPRRSVPPPRTPSSVASVENSPPTKHSTSSDPEDEPQPSSPPQRRPRSSVSRRRASDASMQDEQPVAGPSRSRRSPEVDEDGEEDEIEFLDEAPLSARTVNQSKHRPSPVAPAGGDEEEDEEDEDDLQPISPPPRPSVRQVPRPNIPPRGLSSTIGDQTISFDLPSVSTRLAQALLLQPPSVLPSPPSSLFVQPKPKAIDPDLASTANVHSESAALELQRTIDKSDFALMKVVGQYNLGFIVVRKRSVAGDDLFIVDQHASDEKFNFETLQLTTRIQSQKLLHPRPLELSASDAVLVMENIEVLRQNGFDVSVDQDEETEETRLALSAQPISKETVFDFKDLEELLHLMHDRPTGEMVRCSKARSMFAMRACRKSIMIGKSLTKNQMSKVVQNMGLIDQPWNCPHGRPTMRHLMSLNRVAERRSKGTRRELDWSSME